MASQSNTFNLRWGMLSCGGIAKVFTKDLLVDTKSRGATDISHTVVAAATRNSSDRAKKFLEDTGSPSSAKAYGSYAELVKDPDVQIVYVSTPHSHHYQHVRLCLEAGKHVLCEKAFTTNADQAKILVKIAKEKGLFLMEAVWTRYFPVMLQLSAFVKEGKLGTVHRVFADLSFATQIDKDFPPDHRMVNLDLAGGCLLDIGIYSITWIFQFLYHILPPNERASPKVSSALSKYDKTGCDVNTTVVMKFPPLDTHGVATTTLRVAFDPDSKGTAGPSIRIQGELGEVQLFGAAYRPASYKLIPGSRGKFEYEEKEIEYPSQGMNFEADECARCLRDGKLESDGLNWLESVTIMEVMDEVRKQNDFKYPENIESTEYPLPGF